MLPTIQPCGGFLCIGVDMINSHHKCDRCGECCKSEVCDYGAAIYKTRNTPCLGFQNKSCGLFDVINNELKSSIAFSLGIGMGCCNDFKEWGENVK